MRTAASFSEKLPLATSSSFSSPPLQTLKPSEFLIKKYASLLHHDVIVLIVQVALMNLDNVGVVLESRDTVLVISLENII